MHPDDSKPVVRNIHLGPNTGIYIPRESGIPLYTNVLALRLDVRRGCQVALVEQIHKIYSVLPCPSPTSNLLFHSLEVREFPPFCHKRGYPPLLSPQPLAYFTPLIPCKIQKDSLMTNIVPHHPPRYRYRSCPSLCGVWNASAYSDGAWWSTEGRGPSRGRTNPRGGPFYHSAGHCPKCRVKASIALTLRHWKKTRKYPYHCKKCLETPY